MSDYPYPDHIAKCRVKTTSHEQMRVEAFSKDQASLMMDEPLGFDIGDPPDLMGGSRGWTPVDTQLAALAGCTSITITVVARDQGFVYTDLKTDITSLIDLRGFYADLDRQPKFEQVTLDLFLWTQESGARLKALAAETDRRCPQIGVFRLARLPMVMRWFVNGGENPALEEHFFIPEGALPEARLRAEKMAS